MHQGLVPSLPVAAMVVSCLIGLAGSVCAQQPAVPYGTAGTVAPDVVRIRRVIGAGPRLLVDTPKYQAGVSGGIRPVQKWAQIQVEYDTSPDWIDELVFQYYVMTRKTEAGRQTFSLFKTTVRYMDIKRGRDHVSTVFLRPVAM